MRPLNSTLHPQPTQQCDNAPLAIVVGSDGSWYDSNDHDNGIGDSNEGGDGRGNGSGDGGSIDDGDSGNSGSGYKMVAATEMAAGTNNNQLKVAAEKTAVMVVAATAIAVGKNNNQLKVVVE